jgi:hypothetical protein
VKPQKALVRRRFDTVHYLAGVPLDGAIGRVDRVDQGRDHPVSWCSTSGAWDPLDGHLPAEGAGAGRDAGVAVDAARERRRAAVVERWKAEARPLRAEATRLREQADRHRVRTDELLAALYEHEGCAYEPTYRPAPLDLVGLVDPAAVDPRLPATAQLRARADALDARAGILETREVPDAGQVARAPSVDDLVEDIDRLDALQVGPRLDHVAEWGAPAFEAVRSRSERLLPAEEGHGDAVVLNVFWRDGRIDEQRSRAYLEPPPAPIERHLAEPWPGY